MRHIEIKNWEKHQHYKKRNPPWIKLYHCILDKFKADGRINELRELSDGEWRFLVSLWLLACRHKGLIPYNLDYIQEQTACNMKHLNKLLAIKMLSICGQDDSKVLAPDTSDTSDNTENRNTEMQKGAIAPSALFDTFMEKYPRKEARKKAQIAWDKLDLDKHAPSVMANLEAQLDELESREKKFRPLPASWLNAQDFTVPLPGKSGNCKDAAADGNARRRAEWDKRMRDECAELIGTYPWEMTPEEYAAYEVKYG